MSFSNSVSAVGVLLAAMALVSLVEVLIPLRARNAWSRTHLAPNLTLTAITLVSNLLLNVPILLGLVWLQGHRLGLFNRLAWPPAVALVGSVVVLDFAWYVTHVSLHKTRALWPFHAVHHTDPMVDVTTTIRQHPVEGLIRYAFLAVFGFACGVSPAGFALYRVWSALHGFTEHANIRLPVWLDSAITWVFSSPNMHKVHHSRDTGLTDTNYGNIFAVWDRLFGTFTPARFGTQVDYGLDGRDAAQLQTAGALLALPFRRTMAQEGVR